MFFTIVIFLVILSFLVFVHELGHFITARRAGVKVYEFGLGLPPRAIGLRRNAINPKKWELVGSKQKAEETGNTIYSLNWLPIGGFVKPKGEDEYLKDEDSLTTKPAGVRALVMSAGVLMNFLTAMVILTITFMVGFPSLITPETDLSRIHDRQVKIAEILDESPAALSGFESGDIISKINSLEPETVEQVQNIISSSNGEAVEVTLLRDDEVITTQVTPEYVEEAEMLALGVSLYEIGVERYALHEAVWQGVKGTVIITGKILQVLGDIITGGFTAQELEEQIAGPVGIARMTGDFIDLGIVALLQFAALLSINLAIINILPFPALDGGRILFIIIEKIRGKPVSQKIENIFHSLGFALLILLILLVTYNDIAKLLSN